MSSSRRGPRRVLIVDDSSVIRTLLGEHISQASGFVVTGEASTGYQAIRMVHEFDPDIVMLDLTMPDLGGLATLDYIMSEAPRPVVIVSAQTTALADPVLSAMMSGAVDFVGKPTDSSEEENRAFRQRLVRSLHTASMARLLQLPRRLPAEREGSGTGPASVRARCAVAVAASTGGPRALAEVVPQLPAALNAAVFIVQHMPPLFTAALAKRLQATSAMRVREAEDGEPVVEGVVYLAPGGRHLDLERSAAQVTVRLTDADPLWGVRPAADVMFKAVARTFGPASVGVVLTGMGRDGADGARVVHEVGGRIIVQDPATATMSSMPAGAVGFADVVLPLTDVAGAITASVALQMTQRP
ncbi:chemotaxis response regulator protein-glutamate methylesterase [soil metagenome]